MSARELSSLADRPYDGALLARELGRFLGELRLGGSNRGPIMRRATGSLLELLDGRDEPTLQERWQAVESELWPEWDAGRGRLEPVKQWPWGTAALVLSARRPSRLGRPAPGAALAVARLAAGRAPAARPLRAHPRRGGECRVGT